MDGFYSFRNWKQSTPNFNKQKFRLKYKVYSKKKFFPNFMGPLNQKISAFFPFWSFKSQLNLHTFLWLTLYTRWSQVFMLSRLSFPTTSFSELKWSCFLNGFDGNLRRPSNMVFYQWKMHLNEWKIWVVTLRKLFLKFEPNRRTFYVRITYKNVAISRYSFTEWLI